MATQPQHLFEYFTARATAAPDEPAYYSLIDNEWQPTSWGEFVEHAKNLAAALAAIGLKPGDRIGLAAPTGLDWEHFHVAALLCRAAVVGLDTHDRPERIAEMIHTTGMNGLVVANRKAYEHIPAEATASLRFVVTLADDAGPTGITTEWIGKSELLERPTDEQAFTLNPDDVATIIFTSGSTGAPKGIAYTHRQVCLAVDGILATYPEIEAGERFVCWLPLSNLFQRIINLCAAGRGATTYFVADPRTIAEHLPVIKPHVFIAVPRFFEKMYDGIEAQLAKKSRLQRAVIQWALTQGDKHAVTQREGKRTSPLGVLQFSLADRLVLLQLRKVLMGGEIRFMVSGSAPLSRWLIERFHAMGLLTLEVYGLSENVVPVAMNRLSDYRFGSVGYPVDSNTVVVAEDGEVLVKGPGVFAGYIGEAITGNSVDESGFLHTGDLGVLEPDGKLTLVGRKSEIFKTSTGRKIAPVQIESKLIRIDGIDHAVIFGAGQKLLIAVLAPAIEKTKELSDETLFREFALAVANRIASVLADEPDYYWPGGLVVLRRNFTVHDGELTSNLKLRRKAILESYQEAVQSLYTLLENRDNDSPDFIEMPSPNFIIINSRASTP